MGFLKVFRAVLDYILSVAITPTAKTGAGCSWIKPLIGNQTGLTSGEQQAWAADHLLRQLRSLYKSNGKQADRQFLSISLHWPTHLIEVCFTIRKGPAACPENED